MTTTAPAGMARPLPMASADAPRTSTLRRQAVVLARRSLIKTWRTPEALIDVTLQPIIFLALFTYIFGGAIAGGSQDAYLQFLLPGLLGQTIAMASVSLGQNLNADIEKGVFDRFRSLPIGRSAPLVVEIGFGNGEQLLFAAERETERDFIGIEVHGPGVGRLLNAAAAAGLRNLRVYQHDAVEVLRDDVAPASLDEVRIYFPDPWHKKRHHKRRLVQPAFVQLLVGRLAPGGYLHCATDWQPYAEQMLQVLGAEAGLVNTAEGFAERPAWRPQTKFEARGLKLGHGVWDLLFRRSSRPSPSTP